MVECKDVKRSRLWTYLPMRSVIPGAAHRCDPVSPQTMPRVLTSKLMPLCHCTGCSQALLLPEGLSRRTGTPVFMAPEVYARKYGRPADLWSAGIMMYQLLAGRFPFWCVRLLPLLARTFQIHPHLLPCHYSRVSIGGCLLHISMAVMQFYRVVVVLLWQQEGVPSGCRPAWLS